MPGPFSFWTLAADRWLWLADGWLAAAAAALFLPAGLYCLLSALDDFALDACWAFRSLFRPRTTMPAPRRQQRIALWLPLWQESGVVGRMLEHNLAAIDYSCYEIFAGVYPNDPATRSAVLAAAARFPRVHLAEVPHDGPTSKADCLNAIHARMLRWERDTGQCAEVVLVHDAEDLIHPDSLHAVNFHTASAGMVQIPVLPLPTPWGEFTHGLYCDDFAESQGKDLETRVALGGFLPGCGVGTAFRRDAIDALACDGAGGIFRPDCLTEDYDIGLRLFALGFRQRFVPIARARGVPAATREFFPRRAAAAVRQRTRWVTGNALQAWQFHGWGGGLRRPLLQAWFLWRDRKGLWGNPVSLVCNLFLLWGAASWAASLAAGRPWSLAERLHPGAGLSLVLALNSLLLLERLAVRMAASARIYGWRFAAGVPLRLLWGNWVNARAAVRAVATWAGARLRHRPLGWVKTEHCYPGRDALRAHKRTLAEVVAASRVSAPLALSPPVPGESGLSEDELYAALSLRESLPLADVDPARLHPRVARALPGSVVRRWNVLPFRVAEGALDVAGPCAPEEDALREIARFTRLEVRFWLLKPSRFNELRQVLHAAAGARQNAPVRVR